ncbi:hypothetical protein L4D15_23815 [Enterovibrio norvegicus]|uniref:hypothetical protein n=1 Tax=Enterovibrio norvegicus TaxID=188144 RepID=UPI003D0B5066
MNPIVLGARDRFNVLELGAGRAKNCTEFRCSACLTISRFTEKSFAKNMFKDFSIFPPDIRAVLEVSVPFTRANWEEFLDFECSGCGGFIRIIYIPNEYRMGCHYYILRKVIEMVNT